MRLLDAIKAARAWAQRSGVPVTIRRDSVEVRFSTATRQGKPEERIEMRRFRGATRAGTEIPPDKRWSRWSTITLACFSVEDVLAEDWRY